MVLRRGQEFDLLTVKRLGLVRDSMAIAWVDCYREFAQQAGLKPDPETEAAIRRAAAMPYEVRQDLLEGASETLAWLYGAGFEVTIWTAGDQEVQSRKVLESGLAHLVHRRCIVLDKTPERLTHHLGDRDPARTFVVGNSVYSDIRPALAVGIPAFHIPRETWAYDRGDLDLTNPLYQRVERITDLPAALRNRFRHAV